MNTHDIVTFGFLTNCFSVSSSLASTSSKSSSSSSSSSASESDMALLSRAFSRDLDVFTDILV